MAVPHTAAYARPGSSSMLVNLRPTTLPVEICERIIDCFHDAWVVADREALLACALTCKTWLARCRFHLLRNVTFTDRPQLVSFLRLLKANPHVSPLVKGVLIDNRWEMRRRHAPSLATFPLMLARKLTAVARIHIQYCSFRASIVDGCFWMCLTEFAALTTLSLYDVEFSSVHQFGHLILAMPALRNLQCWDVEWQSHGLDHRLLPPRFSPLKLASVKLELRTLRDAEDPEDTNKEIANPQVIAVMRDTVHLLIMASVSAHIEELHIGNDVSKSWLYLADVGTSAVGELLEHCGESLRTLFFSVGAADLNASSATSIVGSHLNLARNTHLEVLSLCIPSLVDEVSCAWVAALLSTIISTHMKDIVITLETFDAEDDVLVKASELFNEETCSGIDASLSHLKLTNFHRLELKLDGYSGMGEDDRKRWQDGFMSRFPKLRARGALLLSLKLYDVESDGGSQSESNVEGTETSQIDF